MNALVNHNRRLRELGIVALTRTYDENKTAAEMARVVGFGERWVIDRCNEFGWKYKRTYTKTASPTPPEPKPEWPKKLGNGMIQKQPWPQMKFEDAETNDHGIVRRVW